MQSSQQLPANVRPSVTNQLKKVCEESINNRGWFTFEDKNQTAIATNIINYLGKSTIVENPEYLELTSACIFQALIIALPAFNNMKFLQQVINESSIIQPVLGIPFDDIRDNIKTRDTVKSFVLMLQTSKAIDFNVDTLQKKIHIIDLYLSLSNATNNIDSEQQILSSITPSQLNRSHSPDDFDDLICLMTTTAVRIGCLDSLKKSLPYYLSDTPGENPISNPLSFTPEYHLLSNAIIHNQKNILAWLVSEESPLFLTDKENFLYQAASLLICQDNQKISPEFLEMVSMVFNQPFFNPNYTNFPPNQSLMQMAMDKNSLYFINLLLQHTELDLISIKNKLSSYTDMTPQQIKQIDCLLKNPRFYALENDWLTWSHNMKPADRVAFQKTVVENYLIHHLPKWEWFNSAEVNQILFDEIRMVIMKHFHNLSCPGIMAFFTNNTHHGLFAKTTIPIQDLNTEASLKFCP